ncbi:MAG TPA: lytic murein transglycosylase B, partial [Mizugakiibacter sp.]|nr:lytic murein transglycosylase B [Mizugakiibacter sp.]
VQRSKTLYAVEALEAKGYAPSVPVAPELPATLLTLQGVYGPEYWITFANFAVITHYNRSPLYAMAVTQLAAAIQRAAAVSSVRPGSAP